MDEQQAGRLLGAADSRGQNSQTKTTANRWQPILGRRQPLGSGATEDPAGSSWTVAAGETQVTNEWGSLGRWLGLGLGAGDMAQLPAGMAVSSGVLGQRVQSFHPWLSEHCHAHRRWSTTLGPVCPGGVARGPSGGTGAIPAQRIKAGLASWVRVVSGCKRTATTSGVPGVAVPLPLVLRPLPLGSWAESPPPHAPLALRARSSLPHFWKSVPKPSLNVCLFLLTGQPRDSVGDGRRAGG